MMRGSKRTTAALLLVMSASPAWADPEEDALFETGVKQGNKPYWGLKPVVERLAAEKPVRR